MANLLTGPADSRGHHRTTGEPMTASDTVAQAQRDITEATRAASAATTAAGKAMTSAAVKATRSTVDATVEATKSVTAATSRAATEAANRAVSAATETGGKSVTDAAFRTVRGAVDANTRAVTEATTKAIDAATGAASSASESFGPAFEDAKRQVQEVIDTVTAQTKGITLTWLDAYDSGLAAFLELGKTAAATSQVEALSSVAEFNTAALSEINAAFSKAARELL